MENGSELKKLLLRVKQEILAGLRHGFFDFSLIGETKNGNRHVTLKVGKNHKFTISPEDMRDEQ